MKTNKLIRGGVAIEAAIYIPLIILTILVVFIYGALCYQQSLLQAVSRQILEITSYQLRDPTFNKLITTNKYRDVDYLDYSNHKPYRYLLNKNQNINIIKNVAEELMENSIIGKVENLSIKLDRENYFITNSYVLELKQEISTPIDLSVLGLPSTFVLSEKCSVVVSDPTEFIRNTDIAFDLLELLDDKAKVSETIKEMFNKAKQAFNTKVDK